MEPAQTSDRQVVERFLTDGSDEAFAEIVRRHQAVVRARARALLGDPDDALDVAQEVFLKAHGSLRQLRNPDRLGAWLARITHSLCRDLQRGSRLRVSGDWTSVSCSLEDVCTPAPGAELLSNEAVDRVAAAIDLLPDQYRAPLQLLLLQHRQPVEIAAVLDLREGTVRSLISRGRQGLRRALLGYLDGHGLWSQAALRFTDLPSAQGWTFRSGYEFVPGGPRESRVFSLRQGRLVLDNADLYPDNLALYARYGIVDPAAPFVLTIRARKLRETARFPDFVVESEPRPGEPVRNGGFSVGVRTGTEAFGFSIGLRQIRCPDGTVCIIDATQFHEYRLEGTPGVGFRLCVDGTMVARGLPRRSRLPNAVAFGDLSTQAGNAHVEVGRLSFAQAHLDGLDVTPAHAQGHRLRLPSCIMSDDFASPILSGRRAYQARLRLQVALKESSRWRLAPYESIAPRDFSQI